MNNSRGYLREDFRLFHLKDSLAPKVDFHYHEFDKLIIYISGQVTYQVEGRTYPPSPWDVLFVSRGDLHSLRVEPESEYERVILWMNSDFLKEHSEDGGDIRLGFELAAKRGERLFRPGPRQRQQLTELIAQLESALEGGFAGRLLSNCCFLRLMIQLDRWLMDYSPNEPERLIDSRVEDIRQYISKNLRADLSIDALAERFYLNRYYLMHRFKDVTGCTLGVYIRQKRLAEAARQLALGSRPGEASLAAGFGDYSAFSRAFQRHFGVSPREYSAGDVWQREKIIY